MLKLAALLPNSAATQASRRSAVVAFERCFWRSQVGYPLLRVGDPPPNPLDTAVEGWLLGSSKFVDRIKRKIKSPKYQDEVPRARRLSGIALAEVLKKTAVHYNVPVSSFARKHSKEPSRDVAAWLVRRLTVATLREMMPPFGLTHPDSVRSLVNRVETAMAKSPKFRGQVDRLRQQLQKKQ